MDNSLKIKLLGAIGRLVFILLLLRWFGGEPIGLVLNGCVAVDQKRPFLQALFARPLLLVAL